MTALPNQKLIGNSPSGETTPTSAMRWTGWGFIVGAILVNVPYALLIAGFDYPDILREPASIILTRFHAGGSALIWTWLAFAWAGLPILMAVVGLHHILQKENHSLLNYATLFGVLSLMVQVIGLTRWVFVVPGLAATYTDAASSTATKEAALVSFQTIHQLGGVLLGEHIGQLFTVLWMVLIAAMMFRSQIFRPWLGWFGLVAAAIYFLAQSELLATVMPFPVVPEAGLIGSVLWLVWLVLIGVRLIRVSRKAPALEQ